LVDLEGSSLSGGEENINGKWKGREGREGKGSYIRNRK
jgi:hypothetical protein